MKYVLEKKSVFEILDKSKLEPTNAAYLAPYPSYQDVNLLEYDLAGHQVAADKSYDLLDHPEPKPIARDPAMQAILDDVINIEYYSAPRVPLLDIRPESSYNETRKKAIREYDDSYCPFVIRTIEEERMIYHIHIDRTVVLITKLKFWVLTELTLPLTTSLDEILSLNIEKYGDFEPRTHFFENMPVIYMNHVDELFTKDAKNSQPIIHYCYQKPLKAALTLLSALKATLTKWTQEYTEANPIWAQAFATANYLQLDRESLIIEKAQKSSVKQTKLQKDFFINLNKKKETPPDGTFDMCLPAHWQMHTSPSLFRIIDVCSLPTAK